MRPGPARLQVEVLAVGFLANRQQARLAQHAVGIAHVVHRRDGVLAGHEPEQFARRRPPCIPAASRADHFVQLGHRRSASTLSGQSAGRRNPGAADRYRRSRAAIAGRPAWPNRRSRRSTSTLAIGPQKCIRGNGPAVAQRAVKLHRPGIAPERFGAVGVVDRGRRADVIGLASLAVQGEPDRRSQPAAVMRKQVPNLRPLDAVVGRGPHFHLLRSRE